MGKWELHLTPQNRVQDGEKRGVRVWPVRYYTNCTWRACMHTKRGMGSQKETETNAGWVNDSGKKGSRKKHRYESLLLALKSFRWLKPGAEVYCKDCVQDMTTKR